MPSVMEEGEANGVVEVAEGQEVVVECLTAISQDGAEGRREAWNNLIEFAETNPEEFAQFSSKQAWTSLLNSAWYCFNPEAVETVKLFLKMLSYEPQQVLMEILQDYLPLHLNHFWVNFGQQQEFGRMMEGALVVASFYLNQPALLPEDLNTLQEIAPILLDIIAALPVVVVAQDQMTMPRQAQVVISFIFLRLGESSRAHINFPILFVFL